MHGRRLFVSILLGLLLLGCGETRTTVQVLSLSPTEGVRVLLTNDTDRWEGTTPWEVSLPPGRYLYTASFPGRQNRSAFFTVSQEPLRVEIPALEPLTGKLRISSNALARIQVDGVEVGTAGPDLLQPATLGPFPVREHVVSATTKLGVQSQSVQVVEVYEAYVEFLWGSRLVLVVSPTDVPSLTLTVDGRPYAAPVDFSPDRMQSRPYALVEASAPGYTSWSEEVSLRAGEVVTASVVLLAERGAVELGPSAPPEAAAEVERVLAAYRRFLEVEAEAFRTLDGSYLPEVLTGTLLLNWQAGLEARRMLGQGGTLMEFSIHTPTVAILSDITATLRVVEDVVEKSLKDGKVETTHWDGVYTFHKCADGVWRVVSWETLVPKEAALAPTPKPGGGGGGGGGGSVTRPAPADRRLVASIILAAINCARQEKGWPPVVWDQELADALQPIVEEEGAYYKDHPFFDLAYWKATFEPKYDAVLYYLGAVYLYGSGIPLSLVPSAQRAGAFAYDWENYADRPCEAGAAGVPAYDEWTRPITRVGIAISTPYWTGVWWEAQIIVAGRP